MKRKFLTIAIAVATSLLFVACSGTKEETPKVSPEEASKVLDGKVQVPETYFKTQEEVKALFDAAGLNVEFVVANFDEKATTNKRNLKKGECDQVDSSQPAVEYFGDDQVGDAYGFYADKGATVIVGYSDHDFDGTSGEDAATDKTPESDGADKSSSVSSDIPEDVKKGVEEIDKKYDKLIAQAEGYVKKPKTYTLQAYTDFMTNYTDIVSDFGKLSDTIDKYESELSSWDGYDIWMSIINKNTKLSEVVTKFPTEFAK